MKQKAPPQKKSMESVLCCVISPGHGASDTPWGNQQASADSSFLVRGWDLVTTSLYQYRDFVWFEPA